MKAPFEQSDGALLAAYLFGAILGTWNACLLLHDGAVFVTAGWLGDAWDLYYSQHASRAFANLLTFGPAWLARRAFDLSAGVYLVLAHLLYFAVPLLLWLAVRAVEPYRLFSRLYLAIALALVYFVAEVVVGVGLWMLWMALVVDPNRSTREVTMASVPLGVAMALAHPVTGPMCILYLLAGGALAFFRPLPRRTFVATAVMAVWLLTAYFAIAHWFPSTNPTVAAILTANRYDYVRPEWLMATVMRFPVLAALWLLLLAPGLLSARSRWRFSPTAVLVIGLVGLWFAAAGTSLITWVFARYTAAHVIVVAAALALSQPAVWLAEARRPLVLYALVVATAFASYNVDLFLFGRFVDRLPMQGVVDVEEQQESPWPAAATALGTRIFFKWGANDYVRDVVVSDYDWWYRSPLASYSYFRSDRQRVLFHPLSRRGDWIPYECAAVERAQALPHDARDRVFLDFLATRYCVR